MRLPCHTLDVFTDTRFGGNPLGVVLEADALEAGVMQLIARELALSETVFVLKPDNPAHSAKVRIFTPKAEVPFAGHPTIGTAILLAALRGAPGASQDAIVVLEEQIGPVRVGVRLRPGKPAHAEFDAPKLPERLADPPGPERLASALGLLPTEIGFENHRPTHFTAGLPFVFVPIRDLKAMAQARVVAAHWEAMLGTLGAVYLYCRETLHTGTHFHARMFAPGLGVMEDPATGSAAAAFAGVVAHFDALPDGMHSRMIEQGYEMGRASRIALEIGVAGRRLSAVRIGGAAVRVVEGAIEV
jgi:trans-2,3-dihydro-3-hydroxyanthranilate isomerase